MDWDDLRYFVAVSAAGSLSGAARALKVNPATCGRHIDSLEAHLGARLFDRRKDGYALTVAGEKLLDRARVIETEVFALERGFDAEDRGLEGTVTVTATETLAVSFLVRNLPILRARQPGIRVHAVTEYRSLNLSRREADVAIRLVRPEQGDLIQRRIGELGYGLYASPEYLDLAGRPASAEALVEHQLIGWLDDFPEVPPVIWFRQQQAEARPGLATNQPSARLAAARAGLGITLVPCLSTLGVSGLERVLPDEIIPTVDLWLLVHRDISRLERVRVVLDFINERAKADAALLAGRETG